MSNESINVTGLDRADVIAALYANTVALGLGAIHDQALTADDVRVMYGAALTDGRLRIDYLAGRPLKITFEGTDLIGAWLYDRDAPGGKGTCELVIGALRAGTDLSASSGGGERSTLDLLCGLTDAKPPGLDPKIQKDLEAEAVRRGLRLKILSPDLLPDGDMWRLRVSAYVGDGRRIDKSCAVSADLSPNEGIPHAAKSCMREVERAIAIDARARNLVVIGELRKSVDPEYDYWLSPSAFQDLVRSLGGHEFHVTDEEFVASNLGVRIRSSSLVRDGEYHKIRRPEQSDLVPLILGDFLPGKAGDIFAALDGLHDAPRSDDQSK